MSISLLTVALIGLGIGGLWGLIECMHQNRQLGATQTKPPCIKEEVLSEQDREMARQTAEVIKGRLSEDPTQKMLEMSSNERIEAVESIAQELIELYGLDDVRVEICTIPGTVVGYYNREAKVLKVDVADLLIDVESLVPEKRMEAFRYIVKETLDTVVHELRHAVQYRAIELDDDSYWGIDEARRIEWARNMANYIRGCDDPKGYYTQAIECDSYTFAYEALRGVFHYE